MSQTGQMQEPAEESLHDHLQPRPDPFLVELMRRVQLPEASEGREEVKPPLPREDGKATREETRPAPTPRPPRAAFNRD